MLLNNDIFQQIFREVDLEIFDLFKKSNDDEELKNARIAARLLERLKAQLIIAINNGKFGEHQLAEILNDPAKKFKVA